MLTQSEKRKRMAKEFRATKKLSKLLLIAVADLSQIKKDPRFILNMGLWFRRLIDDSPCEVCMAGAVMACRLVLVPFPKERGSAQPEQFGVQLSNKLYAINEMREGAFHSAAENLRRAFLNDRQEQACQLAEDLVCDEYDAHTGLAPLAVYKKAAMVLAKVGL